MYVTQSDITVIFGQVYIFCIAFVVQVNNMDMTRVKVALIRVILCFFNINDFTVTAFSNSLTGH